ncbi:MAG: hypothetical protein ABIR54_07215 [Burkholderiaceae bacterium]|jgi:hypothetical protein
MATRIAAGLAFGALLLTAHATPATAGPDLTDTERRWLAGATPPVQWALKQGMQIDIVVLPSADAGAAPLAMGYEDGRCKLVFAMRGNPVAESTLAAIPEHLVQATLEAMTAHEVGHCQRHRSGAFNRLPSGLTDKPDVIETSQPTAELQAMAREMRITRREEAFADLVGLAWTHSHHPEQYAQVLSWFDAARSDETPRGFHDTRHWLALAHGADVFADAGSPLEQAATLWQHGLQDD